MSIRPRRALVGLLAGLAALAVLPATALAAGETLTVTPASTQAGSGTNVTAALHFASGETPKTVVTSLAPGMLGNLNANPACLAAVQLTASCQIGTATVKTNVAGNFDGTLYLVPAAQGSTDASGIEFVPASGSPLSNQYIGVSLNPNSPGSLNLTTTFTPVTGVNVTDFVANFTTLNGQAFTRLPSSCSAATSTFSVTYASGATGSGSGAFTPTGCSTLAYAPNLTASITKDSSGDGATLVTDITQAATEAATKTIVLQFPSGLKPNVQPLIPCLTGSGSGCKIGTATATSPLVPSVALANGVVNLSGTATAPVLSITFPAPFAITINGAVNLANNSATFSSVPDFPLTDLKLTITGPSGGKAFNTDCVPASVGGNFTSQSGVTKTVPAPVAFSNCAVSPTGSGSTSGLANGHPKLKFTITHGKGAGNVATVAIGVPGGLKFSRSAIVKHRTCTTLKNKKKKCTTTTLIKGLGVSGAKAKTVAIKGGRLVITLKKPAGKLTVTVGGPLVTETKALQTKVKKHKTKTLKFAVKVTDAKHKATTLSLKLRAH